MRYQIKSMKVIRYFRVLLCLTFIISELNNHKMDLGTSVLRQAVSSDKTNLSSQNKDKTTEAVIQEALSEDATADISLGTVNILSGKLFCQKDVFPETLFHYSPLILFVILNVLLSQTYVNRMYLIRFIHNSDGEKGKYAADNI